MDTAIRVLVVGSAGAATAAVAATAVTAAMAVMVAVDDPVVRLRFLPTLI